MKNNSYSHFFVHDPISKREVVFFLIMEVGSSTLGLQSFSLSLWLVQVVCPLHHGSHVFLSFRQTEVIRFDFLPLNHLSLEFPFHKEAVYLFIFFKVYSTISNWQFGKCQDFWPQNQNLSSSTCKRCEAGVTLICWILPEMDGSTCTADAKSPLTGGRILTEPTASNWTASLLLFQLLSTWNCQWWHEYEMQDWRKCQNMGKMSYSWLKKTNCERCWQTKKS